MNKRNLQRSHPPALRPGGRHYSENWQAWQTMKNTNLVRIGKVSFFDLGVSWKSPLPWHFLAVFQALHSVDAEPARPNLSSNAIATAHDSDKLASSHSDSVSCDR